MPATSRAQQQLMGADLRRARAGKRTRTGMSREELEEYASTKTKGLPKRKHNPGHVPGHTPFDSITQMDQGAPRNFQEFLKQQGE